MGIDDVLTFSEAAKVYGLADGATLRNWVYRKKLKGGEYRKSDGTWLVTRAAVERILKINNDEGVSTMEILKNRGTFKLIKISETLYEIKDGEELILQMEGTYTDEKLTEQFNNVSKGCVII